jgi:hypothetical protein
MTTHDHDTDPSTPGAKRPTRSQGDIDASGALVDGSVPGRQSEVSARPPGPGPRPSSPRGRPTTDPGVAPPPEPLPVPEQPMGIVVPSLAGDGTPEGADLRVDYDESVDVLLEGIAREQPEWPRTAHAPGPTTVSHGTEAVIPRPQASRRDEPKVVIAQPPLGETLQVGRAGVSVPRVDPKAWTESTAVASPSLAPRIGIAMVAGLVVVIAIFIALQRTSRDRGLEATGTGSPVQLATTAGAAMPAAAVPEAVATGAGGPMAAEAAAPVSTASATAASSGSRKGAPPAARPMNKTKPRPSAPAPKPSGTDLGEFKGAF